MNDNHPRPLPRFADTAEAIPVQPTPPESGGAADAQIPPGDPPPRSLPKRVNRRSMGDTIPIGMARKMFDGPLPPARTCQFFVSENHLGPDAKKCGKPTIPDSSYCCEHHPIVWQPLPAKKPGAKPLHLWPLV